MKFISAREFRINPGGVWGALKTERDLVVTSNGKPIAIMIASRDSTLEGDLAALHRARALRAVETLQKESVRTGRDRLGMKEIEREIRAYRRSGKRT